MTSKKGTYQSPGSRQIEVSNLLVGAEVFGYSGNLLDGASLDIQIKLTDGQVLRIKGGKVQFGY